MTREQIINSEEYKTLYNAFLSEIEDCGEFDHVNDKYNTCLTIEKPDDSYYNVNGGLFNDSFTTYSKIVGFENGELYVKDCIELYSAELKLYINDHYITPEQFFEAHYFEEDWVELEYEECLDVFDMGSRSSTEKIEYSGYILSDNRYKHELYKSDKAYYIRRKSNVYYDGRINNELEEITEEEYLEYLDDLDDMS